MKIMIMLLLACLLFSCNTEKNFMKAVNRYGPAESILAIQEHYPNLFIIQADTVGKNVEVPIAINIPGDSISIEIDTDSTGDNSQYMQENENLRLTIQTLNGKIKGIATQKPRIIHDTVTKYIQVECPELKCPDCPALKEKKNWFAIWAIIVALVGIFLFIIIRKRGS